jgi:ribosomal protein S3AE
MISTQGLIGGFMHPQPVSRDSTSSLLAAPSRLNKSKTRIRTLPQIDHDAKREKLMNITATDDDMENNAVVIAAGNRRKQGSSQNPLRRGNNEVGKKRARNTSTTNMASEIIASSLAKNVRQGSRERA